LHIAIRGKMFSADARWRDITQFIARQQTILALE
jgi:hypothetical protein